MSRANLGRSSGRLRKVLGGGVFRMSWGILAELWVWGGPMWFRISGRRGQTKLCQVKTRPEEVGEFRPGQARRGQIKLSRAVQAMPEMDRPGRTKPGQTKQAKPSQTI